jgi:hypothetical protein
LLQPLATQSANNYRRGVAAAHNFHAQQHHGKHKFFPYQYLSISCRLSSTRKFAGPTLTSSYCALAGPAAFNSSPLHSKFLSDSAFHHKKYATLIYQMPFSYLIEIQKKETQEGGMYFEKYSHDLSSPFSLFDLICILL